MSTKTMSLPFMPAEPMWCQLETVIANRVPPQCGQNYIVQRRARGRKEWWLEFTDYANGEGLLQAIYLGADSRLVDRVGRLLEKRKAEVKARFEAEIEAKLIAYFARQPNRVHCRAEE